MMRLTGGSDAGGKENNTKCILKLSPSSEIPKQSHCLQSTTTFPYLGLFSEDDPYKDISLFIYLFQDERTYPLRFVQWREERANDI